MDTKIFDIIDYKDFLDQIIEIIEKHQTQGFVSDDSQPNSDQFDSYLPTKS